MYYIVHTPMELAYFLCGGTTTYYVLYSTYPHEIGIFFVWYYQICTIQYIPPWNLHIFCVVLLHMYYIAYSYVVHTPMKFAYFLCGTTTYVLYSPYPYGICIFFVWYYKSDIIFVYYYLIIFFIFNKNKIDRRDACGRRPNVQYLRY